MKNTWQFSCWAANELHMSGFGLGPWQNAVKPIWRSPDIMCLCRYNSSLCWLWLLWSNLESISCNDGSVTVYCICWVFALWLQFHSVIIVIAVEMLLLPCYWNRRKYWTPCYFICWWVSRHIDSWSASRQHDWVIPLLPRLKLRTRIIV